jgi:DNA-binding response OmpR family regulator
MTENNVLIYGNSSFLESVVESLALYKIEIIRANDYGGAKDLCLQNPPGVLLVDYTADYGLTLCMDIRGIDKELRTHIIYIGDIRDEMTINSLRESGMDELLFVEESDYVDLASCIDTKLEEKGSQF